MTPRCEECASTVPPRPSETTTCPNDPCRTIRRHCGLLLCCQKPSLHDLQPLLDKEPVRDKKDFPWFWNGSEFTGDRVNDVNLSLEQKAKS